jgi:hypothetical protein
MGFSLDRLGTLSLSNGPPMKDVIELPAQNTKCPERVAAKKRKRRKKARFGFCASKGFQRS